MRESAPPWMDLPQNGPPTATFPSMSSIQAGIHRIDQETDKAPAEGKLPTAHRRSEIRAASARRARARCEIAFFSAVGISAKV